MPNTKKGILLFKTIKISAKKVPGILSSYRYIKKIIYSIRVNRMSVEEIFTDIYRRKIFAGEASVSGLGSDSYQTRNLVKELPILFKELNISIIIDIPCGDFHWISNLNLNGIKYIGADIVQGLIYQNKKWETENIVFRHANLITDELPNVDLVLCRDCFIHFSFEDIYRALWNICESGSNFLLTTTFPERTENHNIKTGGWRVLNLQIEPFNFPEPLRTILEGCTEEDEKYRDKSLGLWKIEDIKKCLEPDSFSES